MKEQLVGAAIALAVLAAGVAASRAGWLPRNGQGAPPPARGTGVTGLAGGGTAGGAPRGGGIAGGCERRRRVTGGTAIAWSRAGVATAVPWLTA